MPALFGSCFATSAFGVCAWMVSMVHAIGASPDKISDFVVDSDASFRQLSSALKESPFAGDAICRIIFLLHFLLCEVARPVMNQGSVVVVVANVGFEPVFHYLGAAGRAQLVRQRRRRLAEN